MRTTKTLVIATALRLGVGLGLALGVVGCGDGDGDGQADFLVVEGTSPDPDSTGVFLDQDIRVVFSMDLDPTMAPGGFTVVGADGVEAPGKVFVDHRTAIFMPARYEVDQRYEVTLSTDIEADGLRLAEPYRFAFTTGATTSDQSEPPGPGYDPLGPGEIVALGNRAEFGLLWSGSDDAHFALEDPPFNPDVLGNPGAGDGRATKLATIELANTEAVKLPVTGQFDGDSYDEVMVLSNDPSRGLRLNVVDALDDGTVVDVPLNIPFDLADSFDAAAGDFDDDGRSELAVAVARQDEQIRYYVVDYQPGDGAYVLASSGVVESMGSANAQYVKVAAGDMDADRKAEAIFAWQIVDEAPAQTATAYYVVHDDLDAGLEQMRPFRTIKEGMQWRDRCHDSYVEIETADVDGDGADEVLFGLTEPTWVRWRFVGFFQRQELCRIFDSLLVADNVTSAAPDDLAPKTFWSAGDADEPKAIGDFWYYEGQVLGDAVDRRLMPVLVAGDFDGDMRDEVMLHNRLFKFQPNERADAGTIAAQDGWPVVIPEEIIDLGSAVNTPRDLAEAGITQDVRVGFIDRGIQDVDLKADVALLRREDDELRVDHFDIGIRPEGDGFVVDYEKITTHLQDEAAYASYEGTPRLTLPNMDRDSVAVEKVGHEVFLGDAVIIAVLAAPPCSEVLGQDLGACQTQFGRGTTQSWTDGAFVTASAGLVAGFKTEPELSLPFVNLTIAEFEVEVVAGIEGSYQHTWGREVSEQVSHLAGAENNLVVFESYVYDRYNYVYVVHPDSSKLGEEITISVPTGHKLLATGQEYYNANNGDQMDIDPDILAVVPGDLASYPSRGEAQGILEDYVPLAMSSNAVRTPQGFGNAVGIEHGVSTTQGDDYSVGLFLEATAKTCGPDVGGSPQICLGLTESRSAGFAHSYEWGSDLIFAGTIAGIPEESYGENAYDVGVFAYEVELSDPGTADVQDFIVVNYFLE